MLACGSNISLYLHCGDLIVLCQSDPKNKWCDINSIQVIILAKTG